MNKDCAIHTTHIDQSCFLPKSDIHTSTYSSISFFRNFSYFRHGCLSRVATEDRKSTHYKEMIKKDSDASLLRMFDAFVESAPQLIIQIYIAMHDTHQEAIHLGRTKQKTPRFIFKVLCCVGFQADKVENAYSRIYS